MPEIIAKLIFTENGKLLKKIAMPSTQKIQILVGRKSSGHPNEIVLQHQMISGEHALIENDSNGHLFVKDLNSTNGTFLNYKKMAKGAREKIKPGDIVEFSNDSPFKLKILGTHQDYQAKAESNAPKESSNINIQQALSSKHKIVIGRSDNCDVQLPYKTVSRRHATIEKQSDDNYLLTDLSRYGTYVNGKLINGTVKISDSDIIKIGTSSFSINSGMQSSKGVKYNLRNLIKKKDKLIIGRATGADIYFDDMEISRQHAEIFKENGNIFIRDLGSTNGTFINNKRIKAKVKLTETDTIQVGVFVFKFGEDINPDEVWTQTAIKAKGVEKIYPGNATAALKPMTFEIPHKAFVALMGPSGCGKTTLMNALNGSNPATAGDVTIHGLELKQNYQVLKRKIGYVPQDDIVHKELSVYKSLYYAAKLKLPEDMHEDEINKRIDEVLNSLNIADKKNAMVGELSGGQRKRVSIAVELLSKPKLLFLDEPTSPLDPETIKDFLTAIKNLTNEGTTVIMVTHKPDDLEYVDRVIFLGTKGYQAYYGNKDELLQYFSKNFSSASILDVYAAIGPENVQQAKQAYEMWYSINKSETLPENKSEIQPDKNESFFRQYFWLTKRYLNIKTNDRINTGILISQAPIIAFLSCWIFKDIMLPVPFMMAISAIWFGSSNAAREIVGELPIYKRERMYNMQIIPYILSKITVLTLFSSIQAVLFVTILMLVYAHRDTSLLELYNPETAILFMIFVAFTATTMGLLMSALVNTTEKVMTLIPIVLIPQIMLAGVITRIDSKEIEYISYVTISRWGTEGFCNIQERIVQSVPEPDFEVPATGGANTNSPVTGTGNVTTTTDTTAIETAETTDNISNENTTSNEENENTYEEKGVCCADCEEDKTKPDLVDEILDAVADSNYGIIHQFHPDYAKCKPFGKKLTGTLKLDIIALAILSLLFFIATFVALKKKDTV